jgi:hypothetical protein
VTSTQVRTRLTGSARRSCVDHLFEVVEDEEICAPDGRRARPAPRESSRSRPSRAGSRNSASSTQNVPALWSPTSSAAASIAARLAGAAGPGQVTGGRRPRGSASRPRRPRSADERARRMRQVRVRDGFSGGNRSVPSWKMRTACAKSFSRCSRGRGLPVTDPARCADRGAEAPAHRPPRRSALRVRVVADQPSAPRCGVRCGPRPRLTGASQRRAPCSQTSAARAREAKRNASPTPTPP